MSLQKLLLLLKLRFLEGLEPLVLGLEPPLTYLPVNLKLLLPEVEFEFFQSLGLLGLDGLTHLLSTGWVVLLDLKHELERVLALLEDDLLSVDLALHEHEYLLLQLLALLLEKLRQQVVQLRLLLRVDQLSNRVSQFLPWDCQF